MIEHECILRYPPRASPSQCAMSVLTSQAGRIALRRAVHGRHQLLNTVKSRQKSSTNSTTDEGKTIPTSNTVTALPLWQRLGPLSIGFNAYAKAQRNNPYTTQFCSSLVIYLCGDLAAQNIGHEEYDPWRTMRNIIIGGICAIPSYKWCVTTCTNKHSITS